MPETPEARRDRLRAMRQKYGLGEFRKKGGSPGSGRRKKTRPRSNVIVNARRPKGRQPPRNGQTMSQAVGRTAGMGGAGRAAPMPVIDRE